MRAKTNGTGLPNTCWNSNIIQQKDEPQQTTRKNRAGPANFTHRLRNRYILMHSNCYIYSKLKWLSTLLGFLLLHFPLFVWCHIGYLQLNSSRNAACFFFFLFICVLSYFIGREFLFVCIFVVAFAWTSRCTVYFAQSCSSDQRRPVNHSGGPAARAFAPTTTTYCLHSETGCKR